MGWCLLSFESQCFLSMLSIWTLFFTSEIFKWTLIIYTWHPFRPTRNSSIIQHIIANSLTSQPTTADSFKKSKLQVTLQNIYYSPTLLQKPPDSMSEQSQVTWYHSPDAYDSPITSSTSWILRALLRNFRAKLLKFSVLKR